MNAAVLLCDPKYDRNVGNVLRACHVFGAERLLWTGTRVGFPLVPGARLPREERMRAYSDVVCEGGVDPWDTLDSLYEEHDMQPVCVEVGRGFTPLPYLVHPERAVYVFGPEDGSVPKGLRMGCHAFVEIPTATRTPLNLACAVNVILYDRMARGPGRQLDAAISRMAAANQPWA